MSSLPDWKHMPKADRDRLLTDLCAQGLSSAKIAGHFFDATRNAIIGRCHRLGLKLGGGDGKSDRQRAGIRPAKALAPSKPAPLSRAIPPAASTKAVSLPVEPEAPAPIIISSVDYFSPLPGVTPVSLIDVRDDQCRWPVNGLRGREPIFCGYGTGGHHSYCSAHKRLSYVPNSALKERTHEPRPGR